MPTKARRAREKAQAEAAKKLDDFFANTPQRPPSLSARLREIADPLGGLEEVSAMYPELRLRGGLLAFTTDGDIGYAANLMAKGVKEANGNRADIRRDQAEHLRQKYASLRGKRGTAKRIAAEEGIKSVRTVQKYMKDFPHK